MSDPGDAKERALTPALLLFTLASSVVVATEFIVIGLLPVLANELQVSLAEAGTFAGAFALSAAVIGPVLTLTATSHPTRSILAWALAIFAAGNVLAVIFPSYWMMLAVRVLQGAALPVFISVGTAAVSALAPRSKRGRVLALANTGFVIGTVLAVPAGVALTEKGGWWQAFIALALLALLAAALIVWRFPLAADMQRAPIAKQTLLLRQPSFLSHIVLSVASFASMFAAYTYLAAWLEDVAGLSARGIAIALAYFGLAGFVGNLLAVRVADQLPLGATLATVTASAFTALALSHSHEGGAAFIVLLGIWGAMHTAAVTLCQVRVTLAGDSAPAFAMAMNIASANLGIALGSAYGGLVVDFHGIGAIGWSSASLLIAVAVAAFWVSASTPKRVPCPL